MCGRWGEGACGAEGAGGGGGRVGRKGRASKQDAGGGGWGPGGEVLRGVRKEREWPGNRLKTKAKRWGY